MHALVVDVAGSALLATPVTAALIIVILRKMKLFPLRLRAFDAWIVNAGKLHP